MKYSELRRKLNLSREIGRGEGAAAFTHYLQNTDNVIDAYDSAAREFLENLSEENPAFYRRLPIEFDVPFPPPAHPDFSFIDLFAGIGGFRIAFQEQNGKCVFSSEWDKYAQKTYDANFGEIPFGDITKIDVDMIPDHDILLGGFPCQPFSIAGVSKKNALGRSHGFLDKTQGTLFFDIARIIKAKKPKAFLLENVKNLKSHDKGNTFLVISRTLRELGYIIFSKVVDAKDYVPQHRERIFIAGFSKEYFKESIVFSFPDPPKGEQQIIDILEAEADPKYTLTDGLWNYLQDYAAKHKAKGNGFGFGLTNPYGVSRTLSARYYKDGSEILISRGENKNPRRLTPLECKRLMGFPAEFRIEDIGVSDTQLYKQFGNSVAVPVVKAVAAQMMEFIRTHSTHEVEKLARERETVLKSEKPKIHKEG